MNKLFAAIPLFLMSLPVLAQADAVAVAPQVDSDPTGMIVFALVFVGLIGGYAYVIWKAERKKKSQPK